MNPSVRRIYVEKKEGFNIEAKSLFNDLRENLCIQGLKSVRIINRYDIEGISDKEYLHSRDTIFSEPPVDTVYDEDFPASDEDNIFAVEYLPGQYDQRADSAAQCVQILTQGERPVVVTAKVIVLGGNISKDEITKIKNYYINPVEAREASLKKPDTLDMQIHLPGNVPVLNGFIQKNEQQLESFIKEQGFAMNFDDLKFCQQYFRDTEKRNPTITELKVIDTYWSDHCRHTTFLTEIERVDIEKNSFTEPLETAYNQYLNSRSSIYGKNHIRDICLMDIAVIGMKELRKQGLLNDLEVSEEINASSIIVNADTEKGPEEWLVMFKNETHNHPTEIEPFGGAATCLGGAIRDPLSGRSYVYQAMRVTGSGDPRAKVADTLPGKLPQRKITREAASGYSSYGNQIGLATGQVAEIYNEGFIAKRMEIGAVIAAAPRKNVVRKSPEEGDVIILVGGRTGRDGCGGATGSSKEHDEESILTCGAEVQKGNPPTERKIQRLFRNPEVSRMIKKCNDFGAGGISVAIGELTEGLEIDLDKVPRKYEGLDGTELAISESQERMAVVVSKENEEKFIARAWDENLEAVTVAKVTASRRLEMFWRGQKIVNISRDFLDTNGIKQKASVFVTAPESESNFFNTLPENVEKVLNESGLQEAWVADLKELNVCSQKGLVEMFDSSIGAGTILMPFGGKYQTTPAEAMAAKIPVLNGDTNTATLMAYGCNPKLSEWSPFHGALYAVVEAAAKTVATGGSYDSIRLTLQEYFEKLGKHPEKWGKPFSALLGAYYAQKQLNIPAIGGKDSMSGTFKNLNVPPTLAAFAVNVVRADRVISPEFKVANSQVVLVPLKRDANEIPDFEQMKINFSKITELIYSGQVLSAHTVKIGGIAEAVSKMAFGNMIGMKFDPGFSDYKKLFRPDYGSIILEVKEDVPLNKAMEDISFEVLGTTTEEKIISIRDIKMSINDLLTAWQKPLEKIFPTRTEEKSDKPDCPLYKKRNHSKSAVKIAKPRIIIPVFPGTNCEYDTQKVFEKAGGQTETFIIKNLTPSAIEESIELMVNRIKNTQIIMLPGGFSGGDEPDGSGKFITTLFRNQRIKEAVADLLENRDGLILGICNGFQALIKLGLLPYGEIRDMTAESPTLTFNRIGRHVSCMVETKIISTLSPWFNNVKAGDIHTVPVSHGEGRFIASEKEVKQLMEKGQIATQYVDFEGNPTYDIRFNPNGSFYAVEGITSPDGRILGKMAHSERIGTNVAKNIPGKKDQKIFEAGIQYFQ